MTSAAQRMYSILLAPPAYSSEDIKQAAIYAISTPARFKALMECFLSTQYRLVQRAAGTLNHAARLKPELLQPWLPVITEQLLKKDTPDVVVRNCVRILENYDLPEPLHGPLMQACFEWVAAPGTAVAIKAFSLTLLHRLSLLYPDIQPELLLLINEQWETATAAFRSRAKKILRELQP